MDDTCTYSSGSYVHIAVKMLGQFHTETDVLRDATIALMQNLIPYIF